MKQNKGAGSGGHSLARVKQFKQAELCVNGNLKVLVGFTVNGDGELALRRSTGTGVGVGIAPDSKGALPGTEEVARETGRSMPDPTPPKARPGAPGAVSYTHLTLPTKRIV